MNLRVKERKNVKSRNNELSKRNESNEIPATRNKFSILGSTNDRKSTVKISPSSVTEHDVRRKTRAQTAKEIEKKQASKKLTSRRDGSKKMSDYETNAVGAGLVERLRSIKQQSRKRFNVRLSEANDVQISPDTFVQSVRVIDDVCMNMTTTGKCENALRPLGFVPFTTLEHRKEEDEADTNCRPSKHWSLDEDNEEDMFAEAKDGTENILEFSQWEYKPSRSDVQSFSGFSPSTVQYATDKAVEHRRWDQVEYSGDDDTMELKGFSSVQRDINEWLVDDWRCRATKYLSDDVVDQACNDRHLQDVRRIPDDESSPRDIRTALLDGSSDAQRKRARDISSAETKCTKKARRDDCKSEDLAERKSWPIPVKYPTSINKRSVSASGAVLATTEIIDSEEISNIKDMSRGNSNVNSLSESRNSLKLPTYATNTGGFSTASGRSISVSEAALKKAEIIYSKEVSNVTDGSLENLNLIVPESRNMSKPAKDPLRTCGFSTAGGRSINVSGAALKKAEMIYSEEASNIKDEYRDNNAEAVPESKQSSKISTYVPSSCRFSTAVEHSTSVSAAALKKAEIICSEEGLSIKDKCNDNNNLETVPKSRHSSKLVTNSTSTCGFSTAGGRSISVSGAALKKAEIIYLEEASSIKDESYDNNNLEAALESRNSTKLMTYATNTCGFSTAGGRSISVSKAALKKAEIIYSEEASSINDESRDKGNLEGAAESRKTTKPTACATNSCGFSTAGGRSISVSKAALKKAEIIYSEEASSINDESRDKGNLEGAAESRKTTKPTACATNSCGFSTAGGRSINVSGAALKKAEIMYSEEASSIKGESRDNNSLGAASESKNTTKLTTCATYTSGFSTAGGRSMSVSKAALKKAETIYSEEVSGTNDESRDNSNLEALPVSKNSSKLATHVTRVCGVATGGGRSISIPESAGSKAQRIYSELDGSEARTSAWKTPKCKTEETIDRGSATFGFATASGRELKISSTALSKAKALFEKDESIANFASASKDDTSTTKRPDTEQSSFTVEQEKFSTDFDNFESINFDDFVDPVEDNEQSRKRRFDEVDEETPLRRDANCKQKRGRYVSELQGKKLLFENSCYEDDASTIKIKDERAAKLAIRETHLSAVNPGKISISEVVDASAAVLLEDKKRSKAGTLWKSGESSRAELQHEMVVPNKSVGTELTIVNSVQKINPSGPVVSTSSNKTTRMERSSLDIQPESIPDDLTFDSPFDSQDNQYPPLIDDFILETIKIMEARLAMTRKQEETIRGKRRTKPQSCDGFLYKLRISNRDSRISWKEFTNGTAPLPRKILSKGSVESDALTVTPSSAESYSFCRDDLFGSKYVEINAEGIKVGDDAFLILDEKNRAGVREFERAFLASPGVDPNLVVTGWVKNHYRWIVWKLASMDRVNFGHKCLPRMLTPDRVMYELKYRYDREIYRTQWPPLRRVLERNEDASARIVLCVASITAEENHNAPKGSNTPNPLGGPSYKMKLTDGWYCIDACIDAAMINCIKNGKVKEGTKLMTVGAKIVNLDQGCSALEIPADVAVRIHTNSTRRVRWDTKLDYCHTNRGPMALSLKSIKPNGGMICKLVVAVARLYPILYREKLPDGEFVFRNARCDEEAALAHESRHQSKMDEIYANARTEFQNSLEKIRAHEKSKTRSSMEQMASSYREREEELRQKITTKLRECLPPPRDVTPVMKIRIAEGDTNAMLTIWSNDRDTAEIFVEGSSVVIYNAYASRQRLNELQITAGRSTFMKRADRRIIYPERSFTPLMDIVEPGFNPVFGEFDTIGIISSIGPAPHGMKNFETVNLACPRAEDDNESSFLSVLFWQGLSTHGYSKILTVGALVACSNLEWRKNTVKSIPTAYCTERSVFSKNPRQNHLSETFETLRRQIKEPFAYAATCAAVIDEEIAKKSAQRTPGKGTPYKPATSYNSTPGWTPRDLRNSTSANSTPGIDSKKASTIKRLEKLEAYGEPPKLPPIVVNQSSRKVLADFRSPIVTPVTKS